MPAVTIALATCNGARFLEAQIASIRAQTFTDFEVLVGDDASDDGTIAILERHAAEDPRFTVVRNASRKGLQRNFEGLIAAARGEWIAPCDQDDVWEVDKLTMLLEAANAPDVVMVYSDSLLVDAEGQPIGRRAFETMTAIDGGGPLVFAFANCVSGHAMMFHRRLREIALPFPDVPIYDWWLAAAATSIGRIVRIDRPLVRYRQHDANVTDMAGRRQKRRSSSAAGRTSRNEARDRDVAARLSTFARLPSAAGAAYGQLEAYWRCRASGWFAWSFAHFAWTNRRLLWAVKPGSHMHDLLRCAKFAIGCRWFALFSLRPTGKPSASFCK